MYRYNGQLPPMAPPNYGDSIAASDLLGDSLNQPQVFGQARLRILDDNEEASIEQPRLASHGSEEYSRCVEREMTTKPLAKRIIKVVAKVALALTLPVIYVVGLVVAPFFFAGNSVYQGIRCSPVKELTGERCIDKAALTKAFFKELAIAGVLFPVSSGGLTKSVWWAGSRRLEEFCPSESKDSVTSV